MRRGESPTLNDWSRRMRQMLAVAVGLCLAAPAAAQEKVVVPLPPALQGLPFSAAVRVGDVLYLSGQIGTLPGTRTLAAGGVGAETRQTLANIRATLERVGSSLDRVVKCTVFLVDITDYQAMNEVYATFFPKDPPARSTVAGSGLALGARVEIECIALAGG